MAHAKVVGNSAFAYMGAERIVNNGTMVVDFELNKKQFKVFPAGGPPKPDRTAGDLLISLEYSNGGSNPIVTIYAMANIQNFPSGQTVDFVKVSDATTLSAVHSATNFVDLANSGFGYTIPTFDFAEASIDLSKLGIATGLPRLLERPHAQPHRRRPRQLAAQGHGSALRHRPQQLRLGHDRQGTRIPESGTNFDYTTTGGAPLPTSCSMTTATRTPGLRPPRPSSWSSPAPTRSQKAAEAGWKLTGLDCDDGNSTVNVDTGVATIKVGNNEHVTCTYTNTKLGKIIVEKQTEPDGAAGSFVFTGDAAGSIGDGEQIVVDNLLPGTYTSTENDPAPPFDLSAITCDDNNSTGTVANSHSHLPSRGRRDHQVHVRQHQAWLDHDHQGRAAQRRPGLRVHDGPGRASASMTTPTRRLSNTFTATIWCPAAYTVTEATSAAGSSPV